MNYYISSLLWDRAAQRTLKIRDLYSIHRIVYHVFEDTRSEAEKNQSLASGLQWVDKGGNEQVRQVLVLSNRMPSPEKEPSLRIQTQRLPDNFLLHTNYRFQVVFNPTIRDSKTRQIVPVKHKEDIIKWFTKRCLDQWGFTVAPELLQIGNIKTHQFVAQQHKITLQQVSMQGQLMVVNPSKFKETFLKGIGRNRSFGCGLLQISPILMPPPNQQLSLLF